MAPYVRPILCNVSIQKYSRLRCLLRVKSLVICFYLGWSGSILQFRQNIIKVGSKSWLLTCSSTITLSLPSYTGSALKRELNFCNGYLSMLYFWAHPKESWNVNWTVVPTYTAVLQNYPHRAIFKRACQPNRLCFIHPMPIPTFYVLDCHGDEFLKVR